MYLYEVTFKKDGKQDWDRVRGLDKVDACRRMSLIKGDITIVSVSRVGN